LLYIICFSKSKFTTMRSLVKFLFAFWMLATSATSVAQTVYIYDAGEFQNLEFVGKTTDSVITIPEDVFVLMVLFSEDMMSDEDFDAYTEDFPFRTRGPREPAFQACVPMVSIYGDFIMFNTRPDFWGRNILHIYMKKGPHWYQVSLKNERSLVYTLLNEL